MNSNVVRAIRAYEMRMAFDTEAAAFMREEEARLEEWSARFDALAADIARLVANPPA